MKTLGSNDKTLKTIENGFIELYCDVEKDALEVVMIDWILKQAKKGQVLGNLINYKLKIAPKKEKYFNFRNILISIGYLLALN